MTADLGSNTAAAAGRAFRPIAALLFCLAALAACASLPRQELQALGSQVYHEKIDFADLKSNAERAKAAYQPPATIRAAYPKTVRVATPGRKDVQYFIEQDDAARTQYLVVRGSADRRNLTEDFAVRVRDDRKIKIPVHRGFDADARIIWDDARPYLKPGYTTYLVGHSLGGAVAAILGIYAIEDGYKVDKIVTYGQPRFTTAEGVREISFLPLMRVVDENDIIPMLPPGLALNKTLGPYEQAGPEVILLEGPDYVYLPKQDASRLSVGEFWRNVGIVDLKDHKLDEYLARISAKLDGSREVAYNAREHYIARKGQTAASLQP